MSGIQGGRKKRKNRTLGKASRDLGATASCRIKKILVGKTKTKGDRVCGRAGKYIRERLSEEGGHSSTGVAPLIPSDALTCN